MNGILKQRSLLLLPIGLMVGIIANTPAMFAQVQNSTSVKTVATGTTILNSAEAAKLAPATVFFRGQSASLQMRNTYGLRSSHGEILLVGLVDSSGYSNGIQQKYQGYLLTEMPVKIAGKKLPAGAYGFGFLGSNVFTVMNLGAQSILQASWSEDAAMARPRPFQIVKGAQPNTFRLYEGRKFLELSWGE